MVSAQTKVGCVLRSDVEPLGEPRPDTRGPSTHVSVDTMRLGYRLFLGRDVEEEFVDELTRAYPTLPDLRHYFIHLPEFRAPLMPLRAPAMHGHEAPMRIDGLDGQADLGPLFEHVRQTWQRFGETEPHWSVSTNEKFLQENLPANRKEFYDSGSWDADRFLRSVERNGIDPAGLRSCIEIGCGVGRVTAPLAHRFAEVVAYDISTAHLMVAREYLDELGIGNVSLRHFGSLEDLRAMPKVDAIFTVVVLQHNPPPIMKAMVEEMIRALNPGGVAFFQVPTYRAGYSFDLEAYMANDATAHETMEMHVLPQPAVCDVAYREGARVVEVIEDSYTMCPPGEVSTTFLIQKR